MRRLLLVVLLIAQTAWALDRQPNADFHARRVALAGKTPNAGLWSYFRRQKPKGPTMCLLIGKRTIFSISQDGPSQERLC